MAILDRPPKDWRRPSIPVKVKLQVIILQKGHCKATGEHLGHIDNVEFDHRPALFERRFDTETNDTVPPANDHTCIEAILKEAHRTRTFGIGGEKRVTTAGSDAHRRKRMRSADEKLAAFQRDVLAKPCGRKRKPKGKIPQGKRPWPKRKLNQSRKFTQK